METREEYIRLYKTVLTNATNEEVEKIVDSILKKGANVKHGDNVIHLQYYGGFITDQDINEIKQIISNADLELSRYDMNGVATASVRDFTLEVFFVIHNPLIQDILLGLSTNALWDAIKTSTLIVWNKLKQNHWSSPHLKEARDGLNFGIKIDLGDATTIDFKLEGDVSQETIDASFDKIISLVDRVQRNNIKERHIFCTYNEETKSWNAFDPMEQILKKVQEKRKEENGSI